MTTLHRVAWENPARPGGPLEALLCDDHTRSLVGTLRRLRLGAHGRRVNAGDRTCDQCRGRGRKAAA